MFQQEVDWPLDQAGMVTMSRRYSLYRLRDPWLSNILATKEALKLGTDFTARLKWRNQLA